MSCYRNDNSNHSDQYERGYEYDIATNDELNRADYHHTRRLQLHATHYDQYT